MPDDKLYFESLHVKGRLGAPFAEVFKRSWPRYLERVDDIMPTSILNEIENEVESQLKTAIAKLFPTKRGLTERNNRIHGFVMMQKVRSYPSAI